MLSVLPRSSSRWNLLATNQRCEATKVSLASSATDNRTGRITARRRNPMAVAKLKRPNEDRLEDLAERLATEINDRAAKLTPARRAKADSETRKIAARVQRRTR